MERRTKRELLETLKAITTAFGEHLIDCDTPDRPDYAPILDAARKVIAQAEAES